MNAMQIAMLKEYLESRRQNNYIPIILKRRRNEKKAFLLISEVQTYMGYYKASN